MRRLILLLAIAFTALSSRHTPQSDFSVSLTLENVTDPYTLAWSQGMWVSFSSADPKVEMYFATVSYYRNGIPVETTVTAMPRFDHTAATLLILGTVADRVTHVSATGSEVLQLGRTVSATMTN